MAELIRSLVSRVRIFVKDRRQSPRLRASLSFTVSICTKPNGNGLRLPAQGLKGHTKDLSTNGLALLVPQVHLRGHHLAAEGRELQLNLDLPSGPISLIVAPERYERIEEAEMGCNYLIGVRIVQMELEDRSKYSSFVREGLKRQ
jgi:hypothetical protein